MIDKQIKELELKIRRQQCIIKESSIAHLDHIKAALEKQIADLEKKFEEAIEIHGDAIHRRIDEVKTQHGGRLDLLEESL